MNVQENPLERLREATLRLAQEKPGTLLQLNQGQRLLKQGDANDGRCFLIKEGSVSVTVRPPESGIEKQVATRGEGVFVGEIAFLWRMPRTTTVHVVSPTATFVQLSKEDLFELVRRDPSLHDSVTSLWEIAAQRFEETNEVLDHRIAVDNRVMSVVLSDIHNFTTLGETVPDEQSNVFLFEFMEASEAISREFGASFEDQGDGHKITMLDEEHVDRAVRCALVVAERFVSLRAHWIKYNEAFSNIGLGTGICTDVMSIRRLVKPYRSNGRVVSHAINIAAAMSKFRSAPDEVAIFTDANTALMANSKGYPVSGPNLNWLDRLGRRYSMYRIDGSRILRTNTEQSNSKGDVPKPRSNRKIMILFLSAEPTNEARLRLAEEAREIEDKLRGSKFSNRFVFNLKGAVRAEDLTQAMLNLEPQIVHFSGHGLTSGELCIENSAGARHPVAPQALAALFREFASKVQCVVLNACYSVAQAEAISKHVDYVVGMTDSIGDDAAIAFSVGFYQAIGAGKTIDEAYRLGCVLIDFKSAGNQSSIPILLKKTT